MWRLFVAGAAIVWVLFQKTLLPWFQKHLLPKRLRLLRDAREWNSEHLTYKEQSGIRQLCYRSASGNAFALGSRGYQIRALSDRAEDLVYVFKERRSARRSMPAALRKDPLLDQIEASFLTAIEQYLNEMQMFQYDRSPDPAYGADILARADFLLQNAEGLVQHYGDYMLALTRSAAMDTAAERDRIETAVRSMETAVAQSRSDLMLIPQMPEPTQSAPAEQQSNRRMM